MDNSIGVYIHVPFCKSKCYYCDFNSYSGREHLAGPYFYALFKEIGQRAATLKMRPVKSIFIGGGTPSLVDPGYIEGLLEVCSKYMNIEADAEISMESNPGTLTYDNLKIYRSAGINRLSIGLQAWQDRLLANMGRIHRRKEFVDNFEAACKAGFQNINADLIFGLPEQTFEEWAETLKGVTELGAQGGLKHLSCYSLKIEEGTNFGNKYEAGTLKPTDDELDRSMYSYTMKELSLMGYRHYEISNFAKPGFECRHNLVYWKALEYAGFGAGAHSYLNSSRFSNVSSIEKYIEAVGKLENEGKNGSVPVNLIGSTVKTTGTMEITADTANSETTLHEDMQFIDREEAMAEFMILGLRLTDGVSSLEFQERFNKKIQTIYGGKLDKLIKEGLLATKQGDGPFVSFGTGIQKDRPCASPGRPLVSAAQNSYVHGSGDTRYFLTSLGLDLANRAFEEFI